MAKERALKQENGHMASGRAGIGGKSKIKVTHFRTSHGVFGAERVILGLLHSADADKFDVGVTLVGSEKGLNTDFVKELGRLGYTVKNFFLKGRLDLRGVKELRGYIKENGFDVVHCHDFKSNFYGLLATMGTGVKRVTTVHGSTVDSLLLRLYLAFNEYILIRFFDRVIAVSRHIAEDLRPKHLGCGKVAVIPNGLDLEVIDGAAEEASCKPGLPIPAGAIVIGTVGRLFPDKGHKDLFKAISMLQTEFPALVLLVIGDGPFAGHLREYCAKIDICDRVIFAGVRHDMKKAYGVMDIFAMPSLREGLPMSLLEAILCKRVVVATKAGGMPEVLGYGKRGTLVEAGDPEGLAKALRGLILAPEPARRMAEDAEAYVRSEYSSKTMAGRTEDLYLEVIGGA